MFRRSHSHIYELFIPIDTLILSIEIFKLQYVGLKTGNSYYRKPINPYIKHTLNVKDENGKTRYNKENEDTNEKTIEKTSEKEENNKQNSNVEEENEQNLSDEEENEQNLSDEDYLYNSHNLSNSTYEPIKINEK